MQLNPYLHFNGNCEAALKFYQKVLGARIEAMMPYESGPPDMPTPPDYKKKIMHAKATIDGEVLMGADSPPGAPRPRSWRPSWSAPASGWCCCERAQRATEGPGHAGHPEDP